MGQTITICIDAASPTRRVSPSIYGMNIRQAADPSMPPDEAGWVRIREAGVRLLRMNGGNNATKYNWRERLTSHPDWYNNVYSNDWDFAALTLEEKAPEAKAMWAFQLLGKVAATAAFNFNENAYNEAQWWEGVVQNLAGYGLPDLRGGSKAVKNGDSRLYLREWSAEETVAILDHWFAPGGLGLAKERHLYWNMDNEPEIWHSTHDDVLSGQPAAEEFMQKYFSVAKKARVRFPGIRLAGPVAANEWQWYTWDNKTIKDGAYSYCWLEYFIKRVAQEEKSTGVRLLNLLDLHFYPFTGDAGETVQLHRVFFDRSYDFPEARAVKFVDGREGPGCGREYIFERCREWLDQYMGPGHGVGLGLSEMGIKATDPGVVSVWYASMMGEFMKRGVELFAPWDWHPGMWETLHLFSRYNKDNYLPCESSDESLLSVYPTIDESRTAMTLMLVNRSATMTITTTLVIRHFCFREREVQWLKLFNLPSAETFVSGTHNWLTRSGISRSGEEITVALPPYSVSCLLI